MAREWHYQRDGQQHGPLSAAELRELATTGRLNPADLIWKDGMGKWVPARSVRGLFPAVTTPTASVSPLPLPDDVPPDRPRPRRRPKRLMIGAAVVAVLVVVVAAVVLTRAGRGTGRTGAEPGGETAASNIGVTPAANGGTPEEPSVDVDDVAAAFASDPEAAAARHKGRRTQYSAGSWTALGRFPTYTRVSTASTRMYIFLHFTGDSRDEATKRKRGDALRFSGVCQGIVQGDLLFDDCAFEDRPGAGGPPKGDGGYRPGRLTRLETYNLICRVTGNPGFQKSSFSGETYTDRRGRRFCNLGQQVDHATWAKTFGEIAVEDFVEDDGTRLTKLPGVAWGKWTLACSDGPLTVVGCVMEPGDSPTRRKRVQVSKVGLN